MTILGIDPGTSRIGFGVIKKCGGELNYVDAGLFKIPAHQTKSYRLVLIERETKKLIDKFKPNLVGLERVFFVTNKKTAVDVIEARGVIIKSIADQKIPIIELSPTEIKLSVTGDGRANKKAVAKMVIFSLGNLVGRERREMKWLDDVFDALAIAITSSNRRTIK